MAGPVHELIDREAEWHALESAWESEGPELVTVVGRRRVGKSFLLTRFVDAHRGIYYQATRRTEADQIRLLSRLVGESFEDEGLQRGASFPDWEGLLGYLGARAQDEPLLLVLDEYPYLADAAPALGSILQAQWDHALRPSRLKLVLCGSYVSAMALLTRADQPLHGRRTAQLLLKPFTYLDAAAFLPRHAPRDRLVAYATFGGLPGHLALLDPGSEIGDDVVRHVIDPRGRLFDEAPHVLDAFLPEGRVHYSVLDAIAAGERSWSRIASRVGKKSASLSRPLEWLKEMGLVEAEAPVTRALRPSRKLIRYRLADPYLRFWHRFVAPLAASGTAELVPPRTLWKEVVRPRLDQHLGEVFEEACRAFVSRSEDLPFRPVRVGQWWDARSQHQVDVVALGADGEVLLGECKWGRVGSRDLDQLGASGRAALAELPAPKVVYQALFTAESRGAARDRRRLEARGVLLFTLDDLYAGG